MINKKRLGRTGLEVTQLGYGSMGLRGPNTWGVRVVNDADADRFLNLVLDSGINFIDTAPDYGVSEERIGRYLHSRRGEFYLATKCGCAYTQCEDHLEIDHVWEHDPLYIVTLGDGGRFLSSVMVRFGPASKPPATESP